MQLLAEWIASLPASWKSKTHVKVGSDPLFYGGVRLRPSVAAAMGVWSDWADARIVTAREVWLVEAKIVATGSAYGQVLDYLDQYVKGDDYQLWSPRPVVGVVVAQAIRTRTAGLFALQGIRTIQFTPTFDFERSLSLLFQGAQILGAPVYHVPPAESRAAGPSAG